MDRDGKVRKMRSENNKEKCHNNSEILLVVSQLSATLMKSYCAMLERETEATKMYIYTQMWHIIAFDSADLMSAACGLINNNEPLFTF